MEPQRSTFVAPSFSQGQEMEGDQFAGIDDEYNDTGQFDDFSTDQMDQDFGDGYDQSAIPESKTEHEPASGNTNVAAQAPKTATGAGTTSWNTIKFDTKRFLPESSPAENVTENPTSEFGAMQNNFGDDFNEEDGFDYQNYEDQGYDEHTMTGAHDNSAEGQSGAFYNQTGSHENFADGQSVASYNQTGPHENSAVNQSEAFYNRTGTHESFVDGQSGASYNQTGTNDNFTAGRSGAFYNQGFDGIVNPNSGNTSNDNSTVTRNKTSQYSNETFKESNQNFSNVPYNQDEQYSKFGFEQQENYNYDGEDKLAAGSATNTENETGEFEGLEDMLGPDDGGVGEEGEEERGDVEEEERDDEEEGEEEEGDEDYEEDLGSEGEYSDDVSDDEDISEALNSLGDLEADMEMDEEADQEQSVEAEPEQPSTSQISTEGEGGANVEKKKRKRKKKGEGSEAGGEKQKRKRKKKGEKGEDGEKKKADTHARRNIRKILSENKLEQETLDAQAAELERQRRLQELKKQQLAALLSMEKEPKKEKDSQLKSLLQAAEEDAEKETDTAKIKEEKMDEDKKDVKVKKERVIDISSGEDDEDVVMLPSEEEDASEASDEDMAEAEDVNNSGSHINDSYNVPDDQGRVLVNVGHPTADPDVFLSKLVAKHIKPHQIGGVRFLYDNLVECVNRFKTSSGFGCILAHSMGLGKTIQMIGFIDIFLRYTGARSVMVVVPINTLANWMAEFNMWVPDKETCEKYNIPPEESSPRPYEVFLLNDNYKNTPARAKVVDQWYHKGGVLLLGYEMYRLLSSKKVHLQKSKGRKKPGSDVIDVEEEDRDKKLLINIHEALVNPGPDLVVCDEGHRIKNSQAGISMSLKQIKSKRRIVLTGYPLQNNLIEYWCMVDFVRPNFLGTKTEFCNMFERPIMNGQCVDSTPQDVRLMRYRAHVLHSLLEGFVQRRGHTVLQAALPPKEEYVFLIRMSPIQKKLYEKFMESVIDTGSNGWVNNNPLKAFSVCCKIWNHPDILYTCMKKSLDDNDLDIETGEPKKKVGRSKGKKETPPATPRTNTPTPIAPSPVPLPGTDTVNPALPGTQPIVPTPGIPSVAMAAVGGMPTGGVPGLGPTFNLGRQNEPCITYDWANEILKDYVPGMLDNGGKMVILFNLISQSLQAGDKILVFSQSLFTLNLIEEFLSKYKVPRPEMDEYWCRNKNYFRLDGSTSSSEREKLINQFNTEYNKWVFLLSTRAGSLGINLIGANRVVVVDASWNPCHDCQAICRVYRFGQVKPSYIYRLVTENTMEKKIYDRQINKQGMSDRVVDELNPQNQFRREHVDKLMVHENKEFPEIDFSNVQEECSDQCMITVLKNEGHWLTGKPFTHESLLIDRKELKLTMKEKRLAKQSYVMEKRLNVSYSRPSYANYYPRGGSGAYQGTIRGRGGMVQRPIASVKPMVSTPVPMRPKIVAAPQVLKPGVSVHQVLTTTEIVLPGTNTTTEAGTTEPKKIPAGQQVLVIRTPKGVYIRTPDGKIFAVRSKPQPDSTSPLDTLANTGRNMTTGGMTIVRPTTTTTTSGTAFKTSTGVTVIRPNMVTTTKPLTIIRQGPGSVRTIIPVSVNRTPSSTTVIASPTTAGQMAKIAAQSQKVGRVFQSGTKIRIVTPNTSTSSSNSTKVATLAAFQGIMADGKKVISNSPAFGGGTTIVRKVPSDLSSSNLNVKKITLPVSEASSEKATMEDKMEEKSEENSSYSNSSSASDIEKPKKETTDSVWNLPPIDMKALKLPQQFNTGGKSPAAVEKKKKASNKGKAKEVKLLPKQADQMSKLQDSIGASKASVPKFSLAESSSDSNMSTENQSPDIRQQGDQSNMSVPGNMRQPASSFSTRPSEIDLHEMKLTSNPNSTVSLSQMADMSGMKGAQGDNSGMSQSRWQSNQPYHPNVQLQTAAPIQASQTQSSNSGSMGFFNPGLPENQNTGNLQETKNKSRMMQQGQGQMYSNSNQMYNSGGGHFGQISAPGYAGNQSVNNSNQSNMSFDNQASGFDNSNIIGKALSSQQSLPNTDNTADFTMSGIHNNSSFLSELTDPADDNFLSQLGGENSNQSGGSGSMTSSQSATAASGGGGLGNTPGFGGQSGGMGSQFGNLGMQSYPQTQQGGNYDMFSHQSQQNQGFFPNFSNSQFNRNSSFGGQQNMNMPQQGGFPGGNMYPMGGMMQPSMFPYPAFAPYPYPPMMAPMPYYPMPFQPQYGAQGPNMGQPGGNMGQQSGAMGQPTGNMGVPMGQQGDGGFQSGLGN